MTDKPEFKPPAGWPERMWGEGNSRDNPFGFGRVTGFNEAIDLCLAAHKASLPSVEGISSAIPLDWRKRELREIAAAILKMLEGK